jgi:hypothetical protein
MIDWRQELIDLRNELAEETKHQIEGAYTLTLRMLARIDAQLMTPIDHSGPRWSGYVHKVRKLGLQIETMTERRGGPFAGHHARYVLFLRVCILGDGASEAAA